MIVYFVVGLLGLSIGSFLNVVIYRLPRKQSVVVPASYCPTGGHALAWYDKIPLLSFLCLRGRCRRCRCEISWRYPAVEFLMGSIFVGIYHEFGLSLSSMRLWVLASLLIAAAEIDRRHGIIPNGLILFGVGSGSLLQAISGFETWAIGVAAGSGAAVLLLGARWMGILLFRVPGIGLGDMKLVVVMGLFLGWHVLWGLYLAVIVGAIVGVVGLWSGRLMRKSRLPFAPFLALGMFLNVMVTPPGLLSSW